MIALVNSVLSRLRLRPIMLGLGVISTPLILFVILGQFINKPEGNLVDVSQLAVISDQVEDASTQVVTSQAFTDTLEPTSRPDALTAPTEERAPVVPTGTKSDWWGKVQDEIRQSEYHITWQENVPLLNETAAYQAPNREHDFRTYFIPEGIQIKPRSDVAADWHWGLALTGFGYADDIQAVGAAELIPDSNHITFQRDRITEWYINGEMGLEQGFTINRAPVEKEDQADDQNSDLIVELAVAGTLAPELVEDGTAIDFNTSEGTRVLRYSDLAAFDANGQPLPAQMRLVGCIGSDLSSPCQLQLVVNDTLAEYPIVIDPIASDPDWSESGGQAEAEFGYDVAGGGDVNGDGYDDVIVSAPYYDNGQADEGRIFIYHGSVTGLSMIADQTLESNQADAHYGTAVASAGDVNADGYDDIIVGAPDYDNGEVDEGGVFIYFGSSTGLNQLASWTAEGDQAGARFGHDVGNAGDVDNNGYDDIIIGAPDYDNDQSNEGRVYVYTNSSTGLTSAPWTAESDKVDSDYGYTVSTAGDINGDGYTDIIVGAPSYHEVSIKEGRVYVYFGDSSGLNTTPWLAHGDQYRGQLGTAVGTAGDVNGDGYDEIVIGAHYYDVTSSDDGRVSLYYGSSSGLSSSADWEASGPHGGAFFGHAVDTAGDINNDGYDDLLVGVRRYDNGSYGEGAVFVYYGQSAGLAGVVDWIAEGNSSFAQMGNAAAAAGDVNGDGYDDIIVGAKGYNDEGAAFSYYGSADGLSTFADWTSEGEQNGAFFGDAVSTAGDVNGDGYDDVIISASRYDNGQANEGRVFVFHGANTGMSETADWTAEGDQAHAFFGQAAAAAGDIDGDGYGDIIIGSTYDNGQTDEGRIYVYYGSATGLDTSSLWTAENNQAGAILGYAVGGAGDINNDGYDDIIAGAPYYDDGQNNEGQVVVYYGAAGRLVPGGAADWTGDGDNDGARFGISVDTAGDVNGDGYADIIIGALRYGNGGGYHGRVFVYHGGGSGLGVSTQPDWTAISDVPSQLFGNVVGDAGDVNGDGFGDILIGHYQYDNEETDEGRVLVYHGSVNGLSDPLQPDWTADECDQNQCEFGVAASAAGDFNGDGYDDIIVGAPRYSNGSQWEGAAYMYYGSAAGLSATSDWVIESDQADARLGSAVSAAGNVNGDAYDDVLVGSPFYEHGNHKEGIGAIFFGPGDNGNWPVADFSASPLNGTAPLTVTFTNLSQNGVGYFWEFGDGITSTIASPVHVYTQTGVYTVTLTAYGTGGLPSIRTRTAYIHVVSPIVFTLGWLDESDQVDARFGYSIRAAGDVNGDGFADMLVGTYQYDNPEDREGGAWLYYGSAHGLQPVAVWSVEGNQTNAYLGLNVSTAGDVNGDGFADVVIGVRNYDANGYTNNGRVDVYYGSATGLSALPDWSAYGDQDSALFGHAVSSAGDVNHDGFDDLLIGARGYSNGENAEGRAYVYHGSASGLAATPAWHAESDHAGAWFGYSVSTAGDTNGDNYDDVVIGALYDGETGSEGGVVYIFYGAGGGLGATATEIISQQPGEQLGGGTSVSWVGDVNRDGYDDVLVGAQAYSNGAAYEGRASLHYGSPGGVVITPTWTVEGELPQAGLGWSVSGLGDINGDEHDDFILGALGYDAPLDEAGRADVHLGVAPAQPTTPYWTVLGTQNLARLGHAVAGIGDVDGNGYNDFAVSEPRYNNGETREGRVQVYYTSPISPLLPTADFVYAPNSGAAPLSVVFTSTSSYAATHLWDFGDGQTSAVPHPTHVYTGTGTFTVTLTVSNDAGSDAMVQTNAVTLTGESPVADFSAAPISGMAPLTVTFSDNSTGNITGYDWDFGDGGQAAEANPTYVYTASGVYTVTLTVTDSGGAQDTLVRPSYIFVDPATVVPPNQSPVITITNPTEGEIVGSYSLQVDGVVDDDGVVTSVLVNDVPATLNANTFNADITLSGGSQTIQAVAEDDEGALGFDSIVVSVDDEGPIIDIHAPQDRQTVYSLNPTVAISYTDFLDTVNSGSVAVQVTDENNVTTDVTSDLTITANGASGALSAALTANASYTLTISAADTFGNNNSGSVTFYVPIDPGSITLPAETEDAGWASGVVYDSSTCNEHLTTCKGLAGVKVTAAEIQSDTRVITPVVGTVLSGPDGFFAFPFDQTGFYTLRFEKDGFTYGQREVTIILERSTATDEIYLTPLDPVVTPCDENGCTHTNISNTIQLDIPAGALPAGQMIDVQATLFEQVEFLPSGSLPPGTWETYAFNLSGASEITFTQPITVRLANDRGFAPGTPIPLGYWNQETLQWEHESVGTVDETGQWVIMYVTHFSNFDCNDPIEPSDLLTWLRSQTESDDECAEGENGCYINTKSGQLREWVDLPPVNILGEEMSPQLEYSSARANPTAVIDVQLNADVTGGVESDYVQWELYIEGEKTHNYTIEANFDSSGEVGRYRFLWDGRNALGDQLPPGVYDYAIHMRIPYTAQYCGTVGLRFGNPPDCDRYPTGTYETGMQELWTYGSVNLEGTPQPSLGEGWTLAGQQHLYEDEAGRILVAEDSQLTQFYSEVDDQLDGRGQYSHGQPPVTGPAAAVPITPQPNGGTPVSGLINSNTTWTVGQSPYIITSDVTVSDGVTLSIEPGVQVMVEQEQNLIVEGNISAIGSSTQPITFTAYSDGFFQTWESLGIYNDDVFNNVQSVDAVAVDLDGKIWFGGSVFSGHGGTVTLDFYDPNEEQDPWTTIPFGASGLFPARINDIAVDSQGQKWLATDAGVAVLAADNQNWLPAYTAANSPLTNNNVFAVAIDGNDRIWLATSDGVCRLTPGTPDSWDTYNVTDGLADSIVYSIAIEDDNNIWFGTANGLSELSLVGSPSFTNYTPPLGNSIEDLAVDSQGNVWLIIPGGGLNVLLNGGGWQDYSSGLLSTAVMSILIDSQGQKWIGYDGDGLSILSADNQEWTHEAPPKLGGNILNDMAEAPNKDIWLGFDHAFTGQDAVVTHIKSDNYYDGTISGGYWGALQIGGGSNPDDSNSSILQYVTIEAAGVYAQSSVQIVESTPTLDNVTIVGSGGDGLDVSQSDGLTLSNSAIFAAKGDGVVITQGAGDHVLGNVRIQANGGHGLVLNHTGQITITSSLIADNDGYSIFTTNGSNELILQGTTIQNNAVAARLAVNAQLDNNQWLNNSLHQLEWIAGTMTSDRTWSPAFDAHIVVGDIVVADGVTLTLDPGTNVLFTGSLSLEVRGSLFAVGTSGSPVYLGPTENGSWNQLKLGGGVPDSDSSHLRYVIIQGASTGLSIDSATPTLEYLSFLDNYTDIRAVNAEGLRVENSNFARTINFGVVNDTPGQVVTAVNNYWGDSSGPKHPTQNPAGLGAEISGDVDVTPWYELLVQMDGVERFLANRTATNYTNLTYDAASDIYTRKYPDGREVHFDNQGRHESTVYPDGRKVSYVYDGDGNTIAMEVTAPGESAPHWTWDFSYTNSNLDTITDPAGRVTNFAVDNNGHLNSVAYADGSQENFYYNAQGLLTQYSDRNGDVTSYEYDNYGRIQTDTRPLREVYDPVTGQVTSTSETRAFTPSDTSYILLNDWPAGDPVTPNPPVQTSADLLDGVSYGRGSMSGLTNEWGNWLEKTDATGRTTQYDRDAANNVTGLTLPNGDCMEATYDDRGNMVTVSRIDQAECDQENPTTVQSVGYTYEPRFNRIKTTTDAYGATTTYVYDYEEDLGEAGHLIRIEYPVITDENGIPVTPTLSYTYNGLGFVETETDAQGTVTRYVYTQGTLDEAAGGANPLFVPGISPVPGLLTQIVENDSGLDPTETLTTTYKDFDALGNSQTAIAPGGLNVTHFLYDNMGRVISQTNAVDITTLNDYDEAGNLARRVTDYTPDGVTGRNIVTTFVYDADGRLLQEYTVADGVVAQTSYEYDINGNLAAQTDASGNTATFRYDDANRLVNVIDPTGATITYTHDLNGRVETITDADGYVNRTVYDSLGRASAEIRDEGGLNLSTSYTYDPNNNLETMTASDGTVTCYEYDALNRQTAEVQDCGLGGLNLRTESIYDVSGNPVYIIDERGIVTANEYDALNRLTLTRQDDNGLGLETGYIYDAAGNLATTTDERGIVSETGYDEMNRPVSNCADTDGLNLCTTYTYDRLDNQERITDPKGVIQFSTYNAFGMPLTVIADYGIGGLNATTRYQYDDALNLIRYTDDNNNSTIYTYTPRNEVQRETYADGTTIDYTYDGRGNIATRTDQASETLTFGYDGAGRNTSVLFGSGGAQSYQYDVMGRTIRAEETANGHNSILTYGYNALGDVISTTQELDGVGGAAWQVDYSYDYTAGTYTVTYPSSVSAVYALDPIGRLDVVQQDNGGLASVADYTYDDLHSFFEITYGNSAISRFEYDSLRRTTTVQLTSGANTLADYGYGYDDAGNRTYMQRNHVGGSPADVYAYDNLYQLTQAWYGADSLTPGAITAYNDQQTYTLDTLGNRLQVENDDGNQVTTTPYGPHNNQQLTNSMNRYETVADNPLSYDLRGNTLTDGVADNGYGYDVLSRQISVTSTGTNAEYIYDAMGRRIAKVVNGNITYFLYDKQFRVIEERSGVAMLVARYTYGEGIDELLLLERNSNNYYLHRDTLGSITEVTDSSGILVERYEYDVYGQPSFFDGSYNPVSSSVVGNPYLFTGRRYDAESGNYYYRARIYSPALGRFLSTDPMGYAAGDANLYRYTFNNPTNLTDPTGEFVPIIAAALLALKVIDYGLTAYDIWQSTEVIADPCSTPEEILFATLNLALAVVFEFIEPDDLLPIGVPADDAARRLVMREARRAFDDEGIEGMVRVIKDKAGDNADDILREMGLGQYVDEVVSAICSFSGDTLVSTIDGLEAISTLGEGDWVLAYDEATGTIGYYPILATWVHEDPVIVFLTIDGELIETTPEHPFHTAEGDWVAAGDLQVGHRIQQADGTMGTVEVVNVVYHLQSMYNLTVSIAHTFFVGDGQWLVHNSCFKKISPGSTDLSQKAINWRKANRWGRSNNVTVFEYLDNNNRLQTIIRPSTPHGHAERVAAAALETKDIDPSRVTRIYSELQPCQGAQNCDAFIRNTFPQAKVTFSFEYTTQNLQKDAWLAYIRQVMRGDSP